MDGKSINIVCDDEIVASIPIDDEAETEAVMLLLDALDGIIPLGMYAELRGSTEEDITFMLEKLRDDEERG